MTTSVTDDALREEVRQWLSEHWTRSLSDELNAEPMSYGAGSPARQSWLGKVVEARWAVPRWSEEWFGHDLADAQGRIVEREFARVKAPGSGQDRTNLWANTLLAKGTEALKKKLMPSCFGTSQSVRAISMP